MKKIILIFIALIFGSIGCVVSDGPIYKNKLNTHHRYQRTYRPVRYYQEKEPTVKVPIIHKTTNITIKKKPKTKKYKPRRPHIHKKDFKRNNKRKAKDTEVYKWQE